MNKTTAYILGAIGLCFSVYLEGSELGDYFRGVGVGTLATAFLLKPHARTIAIRLQHK